MKKLPIIVLLMFLIIFPSCSNNTDKNAAEIKPETPTVKVGLALGYNALGDQSFNDMQYNGLIEASRLLKIKITYKVPEKDDEQSMLKILRQLSSDEKCNLIITSGYLMIDPVNVVSKEFPAIQYVLLDEKLPIAPNVTSVLYAQNEGSFVVGALAAKMSKTKKIGFIGGVDIPVIHSFLTGFKQGVRYADSEVTVTTAYCSWLPDFSGFSNPEKGYAIAKKMYAQDIDIIYSVAGVTGNGIIQCASDMNKYVIGVDSDQDHLAKGFVLTSMMKRLDKTVVDICSRYINKKLPGGEILIYNYKNNGISITEMTYTKDKIPLRVLQYIDTIQKMISSGDIKVNNSNQ